ncbi:MAG: 30S ribosome-binding factor RbfA [Phycisphaerales bacterium]|nr:30S ribosome-binding factor RbfA [Phycisphaerales bacterium]
MSLHKNRASSEIRKAVQTVFSRGLNDPRIRGILSVTRVEIAPDGSNATVFVSVLPEEHVELALHGIQHAREHIRSEVGNLVRMRRIPKLHFKIDKSLKKQAEVLSAIARANDEMNRGDGENTNQTEESNP